MALAGLNGVAQASTGSHGQRLSYTPHCTPNVLLHPMIGNSEEVPMSELEAVEGSQSQPTQVSDPQQPQQSQPGRQQHKTASLHWSNGDLCECTYCEDGQMVTQPNLSASCKPCRLLLSPPPPFVPRKLTHESCLSVPGDRRGPGCDPWSLHHLLSRLRQPAV